MHTEEQAKELWCPHVRHTDGEETPANCTGTKRVGKGWNSCIGSKCSQWRWGKHSYSSTGKELALNRMALRNLVSDDPVTEISQSSLGFCGLAGNP